MTISYSGEVPNGSSFGCFWKILWKWRGSVYKLVWRELVAYLCLYYTINLVYRYGLNEDQKRVFDRVRQYFGAQSESIPMSFVLGFYVSLVVKRFFEQYRLLPWPDTLALFISAAIPGNEEIGRLMRRNVMRYMVLSYVITLQRISLRVKKRFPGWQHLVDAGLMLESERKIFEIMDSKSPMSKYWMPLVWATNIINRARKDGLITSDHLVQTLLMELSDIRRRLGALIGYDTVCVPLVYTQVVTLVLYSYFIAALLGRQMLPSSSSNSKDPDLYFPLFTVLQFGFYVGWLKVAEVLINPFGEDDDDIELNWLIDRHIKASYMIVDEMHEEHPELLKDQYWEEVVPKDLPYTVASEHYRRHEPKGSAETYKVKESEAVYANIVNSKRSITGHDDVYADYESVDTPMPERRKNWFSRQMHRMGSMRSSSTAYSSNNLFNRNRLNSVYSSPEAGKSQPNNPVLHHKMSLYDKLVGRKSGRQRQFIKQNSRSNLNGQPAPRSRPRIPTPDVSKDVQDRRLSISNHVGGIQSVASGVALTAQQLATTPSIYPSSNNLPIVGTLLLSPIKESDASNNNTLQAGHPSTTALANSILPLNFKSTHVNLGSHSPIRSVVIPVTSSNSETGTTTNSFVVLPASTASSSNNSDMIPVSISMPVSITTSSSSGGAIITELPVDSTEDTAKLIESEVISSLNRRHKLERQQSVESNATTGTGKQFDTLSVVSSRTQKSDTNSISPTSTLTKRSGGPKHSEVYV